MPAEEGVVAAFHSARGGTGQSMALASVAWILALHGKRVLVVDADLNSPNLHEFYRPFLAADRLESSGGLVRLLRHFENEAQPDVARPGDWYRQLARVRDYVVPVDRHVPWGFRLDLLPAGEQFRCYARNIADQDWDAFYGRLGGGRLFDALRDDMRESYDFVLIDCPTGRSDLVDICTTHLSDVVVVCFTLGAHSIEDAAAAAAEIAGRNARRLVRILPVPMRVDHAEEARALEGRADARRRFDGFLLEMPPGELNRYWSEVEVPYRAGFAHEAMLAQLGEAPGARPSLLAAYGTLAGELIGDKVLRRPRLDQIRERLVTGRGRAIA